MDGIRPRPGDDVRGGTGSQPFLHTQGRRLNVDFLNRCRGRNDHHMVGQPEKDVRGTVNTAGVHVLREAVRVNCEGTVRGVRDRVRITIREVRGRNDSGRKQLEGLEIMVNIQRQVLHRVTADFRVDVGFLSLEYGRAAFYCDALSYSTHLHLQILLIDLANHDANACLLERLETAGRGLDGVGPFREIDDPILARRVRSRRPRKSRQVVRNLDLCVRQKRARLVRHRAHNGSIEDLGIRRLCQTETHGESAQNSREDPNRLFHALVHTSSSIPRCFRMSTQ